MYTLNDVREWLANPVGTLDLETVERNADMYAALERLGEAHRQMLFNKMDGKRGGSLAAERALLKELNQGCA